MLSCFAGAALVLIYFERIHFLTASTSTQESVSHDGTLVHGSCWCELPKLSVINPKRRNRGGLRVAQQFLFMFLLFFLLLLLFPLRLLLLHIRIRIRIRILLRILILILTLILILI